MTDSLRTVEVTKSEVKYETRPEEPKETRQLQAAASLHLNWTLEETEN